MARNLARGVCQNPEEVIAVGVDLLIGSNASIVKKIKRLACLKGTSKFANAVREPQQIAQKLAAESKLTQEVAKAVEPTKTLYEEAIKTTYAEQKAAARAEKILSSCKTEANAFEIAKNGGKHSGFYNQYFTKSYEELSNGVKSIEKQIAEHLEKIKNPEKFFPHFKSLDPREQAALISKKWPSDIQRQIEQKRILEGILLSKAT